MDVSGQSLLPLVALLAIALPGQLPKVFGGSLLAVVLVLFIVRLCLRSSRSAAKGRNRHQRTKQPRGYRGTHVGC